MVEESEQYEFENTLSGGLPDGYITALINHVRTFLGKDISRNASIWTGRASGVFCEALFRKTDDLSPKDIFKNLSYSFASQIPV